MRCRSTPATRPRCAPAWGASSRASPNRSTRLRHIDVFNGDADGLCALRQLRLAEPISSLLVTGVKRDISLLERVAAERGDRVTVLDLSLERNRAALLGLLERGVQVRYFDHHHAGEIPQHPGLRAVIESSRGLCTSMLVDRHLGGRFSAWAVTGAFGDGLDASALALGLKAALSPPELETLRELGRDLNYNAYGETEADVLIPPAQLFRRMCEFDDPLRFASSRGIGPQLHANRMADMKAAGGIEAYRRTGGAEVFVLPDAPWSRRVNGVLANHRAGLHQRRAVAIVVPRRGGDLMVSVRVPEGASRGADEFCRGFPGGGGRRGSAGIDRLAPAELEAFVQRFVEAYG
jgi:hypothetical protein